VALPAKEARGSLIASLEGVFFRPVISLKASGTALAVRSSSVRDCLCLCHGDLVDVLAVLLDTYSTVLLAVLLAVLQ